VEVPLATLGLRGLGQGDDPGGARVEVFGEPLDGAALAGGVAALEQDHVLGGGVLRPVLELQQLDLQLVLLLLVGVAVEPLVVGVVLAPGLDRVAAGVDQVRVGMVRVVPHAEAVA
jgi:acetyl-CoA acetyltransferase